MGYTIINADIEILKNAGVSLFASHLGADPSGAAFVLVISALLFYVILLTPHRKV